MWKALRACKPSICPAHLFGTDEFSVYVSEHDLGENLAHGLIGEVIREAQIEQTLANYKSDACIIS